MTRRLLSTSSFALILGLFVAFFLSVTVSKLASAETEDYYVVRHARPLNVEHRGFKTWAAT